MSSRPPIEERFAGPSVMGVVNVTPDSFSDDGVHLRPRRPPGRARAMLDEGAAIVDVGGESTRPGSDGVSLDEELRAGRARCSRRSPGEPVSIDTAKAEVARRALDARGRAGQRRDRAAGRPRARGGRRRGGRLSLPDAHARRAADDAGRPGLRRRRLRREGVPRGAARLRGRRRGSPRSSSASTRESGSGRRSRTTSSWCAAWTSSSRSGGRSWSASRARARSRALLDPRRDVGVGTTPRSAAAVAAYDRGATILRAHDVREHVEALRAAQAVCRGAVRIELHGIELFGHHGVGEEERRRASGSSTTSSSRSASGAPTTGSRTPSTTARSRPQCARSRAASSGCSRRSRPRSPTSWSPGSTPVGEGARPQAGGPARRGSTLEFAAVTVERP